MSFFDEQTGSWDHDPSESDVLYRGTAAGTRETRRVAFCDGCGSIIDPVVERSCVGCENAAQAATESEAA